MLLKHWLMSLKQRIHTTTRQSRKRNSSPKRPCLVQVPAQTELLEDRTLLAAFIVNSLEDAPIAADGNLTLREAIQAANTNSAVGDAGAGDAGLDTISFSVSGTIDLDDVVDFGDFLITEDLSIDGGGNITIDGQGLNRIFDIQSAGTVTLIDLTLTGGDGTSDANGNTANDGLGGAIFNNGTDLVLTDMVISGNTASGDAANEGGGGLYTQGGTVTITTSSFTSNVANGTLGSGGGILINGGTLDVTGGNFTTNTANRAGGGIEARSTDNGASDVTLDGVTVTGNSVGINGGGFHLTAPSGATATTMTITGGSFMSNTADLEGGGLWNDEVGTMTINGVSITGNTASGAAADQGGGGLFNNGGSVTIQNDMSTATTISNNVADGAAGSGGGILNDGGSLTITDALIDSNTAVRAGGGIEVTTANTRNSTATFSEATISNNIVGSSPGNGGGVHISDAAGDESSTFTITGGSVSSNSAASEGGGLWNDAGGTMTINGVLIDGNTASGAAADQGGGGVFNNGGMVTIQNDMSTATTISNNVADGAAGSGGGILNDGGTLTITEALIDSNDAVRAGGGIEVTTANSRDSMVTVDDAMITSNTVGSSPGNGGGVHITDVAGDNSSTFTITGGSVSNNIAASEGGGLWNDAGGTMTINGVLIDGNTASGAAADQGGGGVFNNGGMVTIQNDMSTATTISNNVADGAAGSGGGILNDGGTLTITDALIDDNAAVRAGGGIEATTANMRDSTITLDGVDISSNTVGSSPGNGGGVHISDAAGDNSSTFTMTGGSVTLNSAASEGGGLWNAVGGTMTINGVNIDSNTASGALADNGGGGLFNDGGTVTIQNDMATATSISNNVADGAVGSGGGILNDGGTLTITDAVIDGNTAERAGGGIEVTTENMRDSNVIIDGATISNNDVGSAPGNGGGVHITDLAGGNASTFTITGSTVSGNSAAAEGGGLWNDAGGTLNIDDTTISSNIASGNSADQGGGGVFNNGGIVNITDDAGAVVLMSNQADGTSGSGGGILNDGGTLTIEGATIDGNTAVRAGGGIEVTTANSRNSIVTVEDATISNNIVGSAPGNGGGVHITDVAGGESSTFTISNSTVSGNSAAAEGGGLWNDAGGTMTIRGVDIDGNTASGDSADQGGGGIFNNGGTLSIRNNITVVTMIRNNIADGTSGSGGGILNDGGTVTMTGGIISGNSAVRAGGGIEVTTANNRDSVVTLTRTTIQNNDVGSSPGNGGGVHISDAAGDSTSTFTLVRGTVSGNSAASEGGGLWNDVGGTLNINGTTISTNTASGNSADQGGGGVFNNGGTINIQNNITATVISDNLADGTAGSGGGILNDGGTITMTGGRIAGNSAVRAGGGIEVTTANSRDSVVTLTNVNIISNEAGSSPGNGGGVHITDAAGDEASTFSITGGSVSGNSAAAEGGGLWNAVGGTMNIDGVLIEGNFASGDAADQGGGGVFNDGGIVNITSTSGTTLISGNIADGTAGSGGGILNDGGTLTIDEAVIDGNAAVRAGGGIEVTTANSRNSVVTITDTTISDNQVGEGPGNGGGVHITDASGDETSTFSITGGSVTGNVATAEGGGLWNAVGGTMTIDGVSITNNTASGDSADQGGGGVFNDGGTVTIQGGSSATVISNNVADGDAGSGGGILNDGGTLTITGATIDGNSAIRAGGGIEVTTSNHRDSDVTVTEVTISNNTAGSSPGNGGGVHITDTSGGNASSFTITDSTVTGNSAASEGGGLWNDAGGTLLISGTTITGNTASGADSTNGGGGVFNNGGSTMISGDSAISGNVADGDLGSGGGIFNDGGTLEIEDTSITGNTANRAGGGIEDNAGTTTIENATLNNNTATGMGSGPGNGGGLHITGAGDVTITGGTVNGNSAAAEGGGLWNSSAGTLTVGAEIPLDNSPVVDTIVDGNIASGDSSDNGGGGIFNDGGILAVTNATVSNNMTNGDSGQGGGIFNETFGLVDINRVTISGNTAMGNSAVGGNGGGLFNRGTVQILDSTVSGNSALNEGGGLWNSDTLELSQVTVSGNSAGNSDGGGVFSGGSGTVDIRNSTVTLNTAPMGDGGGIFDDGTTTVFLESTIVAVNTDSGGANDITGTVDSASAFNLVGISVNLAGISDGINNNIVGSTTEAIDPLLAPLADNGGPTMTHNLNASSPAINAGSNPDSLDFDQRGEGFNREIGAQTDIGAVEVQISLIAVGAGPGSGQVRVLNSFTGEELANFQPYPGFTGGVRVAVGDVNGDGTLDLITAPGPGGGPNIKVFDGSSANFMSTIADFFGLPPAFTGGVHLASANFNPGTDDNADIVVAADAGGGPNVIVFDGSAVPMTPGTPTIPSGQLQNFFAYGAGFTGGVRVAAGDITGDGIPDVITAPGAGGGPNVRVFDGSVMQFTQTPNDISGTNPNGNFMAYSGGFTGGVFVASGDVNGDGRDDIITGPGAGGGPNVRVFSGVNNSLVASFNAYAGGFTGGVTVGSTQGEDNDGIDDIITGPGPGGGPNVRVFSVDSGVEQISNLDGFNSPNFFGGIFVSGGTPAPQSAPLHFGGGVSIGDLTPVTQSEVDALADAALVRLEADGVPSSAILELANVDVRVSNLADGLLGLSLGGTILIDSNASGAGWFIDATPLQDEEFNANLTALAGDAFGRVDLLTVLLHEFGHELGAEDSGALENPENLMAETLTTGRRRLPNGELDALFADGDQLDSILA